MLEIEIQVQQIAGREKEGEAGQDAAWLGEPVLTIGDESVRFPVRLRRGRRLVCRDQSTWRVLDAEGTEVASGEVAGAFPALSPGANRIGLDFEEKPAAGFRVLVNAVKVYP